MPTDSYRDRLDEAIAKFGPLCGGVDPSAALVQSWGLVDDANGLAEFCDRTLEAFVGTLGVIKPQAAFFERHGAAGMVVLEHFIAQAKAAGLVVIADVKRGDIDSTAAGYAQGWVGPGGFNADAMTVLAYMGVDALAPIFEMAEANDRGVYVVASSSNPEGRPIQEALIDGQRVEDHVLSTIARRNGARGPLGAVIGATRTGSAFDVRDLHGPILVPGVGAQGATATDVGAQFGGVPGVIVNVSRALLSTGPKIATLQEAVRTTNGELAAALAM